MFRVRIHCLDGPSSGGQQEQADGVEEINGTLHLFRRLHHLPFPFPSSAPLGASTLLLALAVPARLSVDDLLLFCEAYVDHILLLRLIRDDGIEERYSVLINFDDLGKATAFYHSFNGTRFSTSEASVCRLLFLSDAEFTENTEVAETPPDGLTELPSCPICLERLDQDTSGVVSTICDHSFQCSCTLGWTDSSCPVCHFCQPQPEKPTCSTCKTSENLWICLICGFVGCGRYEDRHAVRHWEETKHCYSLYLDDYRIWDYVGDQYVHRLDQSKNEKSVRLDTSCHSSDQDHESSECSKNSGDSQIEAIKEVYENLMTNQLEEQRQYYESMLSDAKEKNETAISEAFENAVSSKLQDIQLKLEKTLEEKRKASELNKNLTKNQDIFRKLVTEIEERERSSVEKKDKQIQDLEEQIRDITVYLEAQKTLNNISDANDIKEGTVLPISVQQSAAKFKKSLKANKKRN